MKHFRMACVAGALASMLGFGATGCGSDDEETKPASNNTGPIVCGTAAGDAECKRRGAETTCEAVSNCSCESCCQELADCDADPGCRNILNCATETGCRGIPCYQPATCQAVIDENGGPTGVPASIATILSDCVVAAACPSTCN
jgi:hypothetical protein